MSTTRVRFRRQEPIADYIVDFVALAPRLVVEADGQDHGQTNYDAHRDRYLESLGYRVLRFDNRDIALDLEGVIESIKTALSVPP